MKRVTLITIAALLAATTAHAGWWKTYGGSDWGEGHCVQEIQDGYIVTGSQKLSSGKTALWLLKVDSLGDTVWSKTYGATDTTEAVGNFIRQTQDGSFIIAGSFWNWNKATVEIWFVKTDSQGDTLWTKKYGQGVGHCIQQTQDGGYILSGTRLWGLYSLPSRLLLYKLNTQGDSSWSINYLLTGWVFSWGYFVQQTEDKGYIVAGLVGDTLEGHTRQALCVIKTDSVGDTLWSYTQGGNWDDYDNARCVRQVRDGGYVALANIGLLKFNQDGDTLWTREYRDGCSVEEIESGDYVFAGKAGTNLSQALNAPQEDVWLFKATEQGDSVWKRTYKAGYSYYMQETHDKGFIVTGQTYGDVFLVKTDSLGLLGIAEKPIVEADNGWNVPHSIGSYIVLHYQGLPQGFHASVFDVSGHKVAQIRGDGKEGAMTWGINQPPGVYFIQALDNRNKLKTAKVVLVR